MSAVVKAILGEGRVLRLLHGTSSAALPGIRVSGLKSPCLTDHQKSAEYYAQEAVEELGGEPVILAVVVDTAYLQADYHSFEEPLSFIYNKYAGDEDTWFAMLEAGDEISWPKDRDDWQTSLKIVGSVRYDGNIHPDRIKSV